MNTQYIYKQISRLGVMVAFCSLPLLFIGCEKSNPVVDPEEIIEDPESEPVDEGNFYKLIRVENFKGDTVITEHFDAGTTLYYSLEQNKVIDAIYQKTRAWDIAFGSLYSSFISGNNGTNAQNYGYGTAAKGGILLVQKHFDDVIDIPADSEFKTSKDTYGTDINGAFANGPGWYLYDFGGEIIRDGSYLNAHIAYALKEPLLLNNGTTVPPRTLIIRTANGNYAKIKMISVYKDIFEWDQMFRTSPKMYFTFEYVMVPAGSAKFEIK